MDGMVGSWGYCEDGDTDFGSGWECDGVMRLLWEWGYRLLMLRVVYDGICGICRCTLVYYGVVKCIASCVI